MTACLVHRPLLAEGCYACGEFLQAPPWRGFSPLFYALLELHSPDEGDPLITEEQFLALLDLME